MLNYMEEADQIILKEPWAVGIGTPTLVGMWVGQSNGPISHGTYLIEHQVSRMAVLVSYQEIMLLG